MMNPTNFKEIMELSKDICAFEAYKSRNTPDDSLPCDILDKEGNILFQCNDLKEAAERLHQVASNGGVFEDYCVLNLQTMHCIPLWEVLT